MEVYAMGNPLGIHDVMTTGIVSGIKDDYIISDTTVLPGNSGGPLITEDGKVVGINSLRVSEVVGGEGLTVSIFIELAYEEFGRYIEKSE